MNYQTEKYIRKLFYDAQSGICPICDKPLYKDSLLQNTFNKISLDHDHATGEPRGLLHQSCNLKVAQIETHTKKLNYIISRQLEARIREYITARNIRISVSVIRRGIE
jgi:hypothetical protein